MGDDVKWQPIETAPRGNTDFLGFDGNTIAITWEGWADENGPVYVREDWVGWRPTHWMPLPPFPKEERKS